MKVSDNMFEGGKYPFSCSIYDGCGLCIFTEYKQFFPASVLTVIAKYLLTSCTKPWKLFIPTGLKGFSYSIISVYLSLG